MGKGVQNKMLKKTFLIITLLMPLRSWGITNIESNRLEVLPKGFSGRLMASIEGKNGNTDKEEFSLSGKLNYQQSKNIWMVLFERDYGKANDLVNDDAVFWHGRLTHNYTARLASEIFVQYEEDEFTRLQSRALLGAGLRFALQKNEADVQKKAFTFFYGLGAFREKEKTDLVSYLESQYTSRLNLYYVYKHALSPQVMFSNTFYYQPAFQQFDDYRVLLNLALNVRLNSKLALQVDYQLRHDNQPPENTLLVTPIMVDETDSDYKTSIVYEF